MSFPSPAGCPVFMEVALAGTGTLVPPPELNFPWPPPPPGGEGKARDRERETHRERPVTTESTAGTSLVLQCKHLLCSAGDVGSIPAGEIKIQHAADQLSPCAPTAEPARSGAHGPHQKTPHTATEMKIPRTSESDTETPTKNLNLFT